MQDVEQTSWHGVKAGMVLVVGASSVAAADATAPTMYCGHATLPDAGYTCDFMTGTRDTIACNTTPNRPQQ